MGVREHCSQFIKTVVVAIDDGTTDRTAEEARTAGATVLNGGSRRGTGAAIRNGIDYGIKEGFDFCVVMGGDAQDDPQEIQWLLAPLQTGDFDFVQGSRYLNGRRTVGMPFSRALLTRMYTTGFRIVTRYPVTDASNGFRAFRLEIFKKINIWQEKLDKYALENYLFAQAIKRGYRIKEVPVTKRFDHNLGFSKMSVWSDNSFWAVVRGMID